MPEPAAAPDLGFDLREAIEHALQTLPEVQRAILQLRDVEGYSYAEIGRPSRSATSRCRSTSSAPAWVCVNN